MATVNLPTAAAPAPPSEALVAGSADAKACRAILQRGSKSFFAATLLLPQRLCAPAAAIYAFCREADDVADAPGGIADGLAQLQRRLDFVYQTPTLVPLPAPSAVDRALQQVVQAHRIPRPLFAALLEGFAWDQSGRRYASLAQLYAYAARVAGSVGVMMTLLMGERRPQVLARAADLGVAMQLTNIARDVGDDARLGRLYLPTDWLQEAGLDADAWLAAPHPNRALGQLVQRLLQAADSLYARSAQGIAYLPADCRMAISAARRIYQAIGQRIAAADYDSVSHRAYVGRLHKAWLLLCSLSARLQRPRPDPWPCMDETAFLVAAALRPTP